MKHFIPKTLNRGLLSLNFVDVGLSFLLRRRANFLDRVLPARRRKGYRQALR